MLQWCRSRLLCVRLCATFYITVHSSPHLCTAHSSVRSVQRLRVDVSCPRDARQLSEWKLLELGCES